MKMEFRGVVCAVLLGLLSGCSSTPESITHQPSGRPTLPVVTAAPTNGAIFQAGAYRPMFEDRRARLVGDILTIAISERTSAGKSAATSASKSGSTSTGVSKLFGVPASTLAKLGVGAESDNEFEEKGLANSSNNFSGTITVTVIDTLPNGNLVVSGEKQVAFDKGVEFVRFSGVVGPDTVGRGNVVPSTQVADARIEYRTNSRIDRAELTSQLVRFFFSLAPL
ncbi:flagellar basal body L-ring protein FlgH [Herbaspirillum sp. GCM10030257]|uniref:flagellar basal body L-ring protein FlgH n=1 Tax=Herbaspirillum sp. GCM10030257 TaxID=3273393 RepID=UPI0036208EBC